MVACSVRWVWVRCVFGAGCAWAAAIPNVPLIARAVTAPTVMPAVEMRFICLLLLVGR
jgi:hypothetical protein